MPFPDCDSQSPYLQFCLTIKAFMVSYCFGNLGIKPVPAPELCRHDASTPAVTSQSHDSNNYYECNLPHFCCMLLSLVSQRYYNNYLVQINLYNHLTCKCHFCFSIRSIKCSANQNCLSVTPDFSNFPDIPYTLHLAHLTHPSNNRPSKKSQLQQQRIMSFHFYTYYMSGKTSASYFDR